MDLSQALELQATRLQNDSLFISMAPEPTQLAVLLKTRDDGGLVHSLLWQEPNGDWTILQQVESPPLAKELKLSQKFDKRVRKVGKTLRKKNATLEMQGGSVSGQGRPELVKHNLRNTCDAGA